MATAHVQIVNNTNSALNLDSKSTGGINQNWGSVPSSIPAGTSTGWMSLIGSIRLERGDLRYYYQNNNNVLDFHIALRPGDNDVTFDGSATCEFKTKIGANGTWGGPGQILEGDDLYVQYTLT